MEPSGIAAATAEEEDGTKVAILISSFGWCWIIMSKPVYLLSARRKVEMFIFHKCVRVAIVLILTGLQYDFIYITVKFVEFVLVGSLLER